MPKAGQERRPSPQRASRRRSGRRRLRLLLPVAVLGLVAFLYWHPLSRYLDARQELARRQQDVAGLRATKALLEQRLELSTNLATLARDARRTGLVRPGEQLFIVKGIPAWRKARSGR